MRSDEEHDVCRSVDITESSLVFVRILEISLMMQTKRDTGLLVYRTQREIMSSPGGFRVSSNERKS
jgi:hypothetical protein